MTDLQVAGRVTNALEQLALVGLASILEDQGALGARIWWEDGVEAQARLRVAVSGVEIGDAVRVHATRLAASASWVQRTTVHEGAEVGLLSPRIKAATSTASWNALISARCGVLDDESLTVLDRRMIGALGEPAFWLVNPRDNQPDQGASRWEMKTRNRGEDFVSNRLAPLAKIVANRSPQAILDGITGRTAVDELGHGATESRTPTGLTTPGPTDNALAWCAMWGIAQLWLVPQVTHMSQTAGCWPRGQVHPREFVLPVFARPVSVSLWRTVTGSLVFDRAAFGQEPASQLSLVEQGVAAIARFPVHIGGSPSAPERLLLEGRVEPLGD